MTSSLIGCASKCRILFSEAEYSPDLGCKHSSAWDAWTGHMENSPSVASLLVLWFHLGRKSLDCQ